MKNRKSLLMGIILLCLIFCTAAFGQKAELLVQTGVTGYVSSVAFSPDGKTLASAGDDLTLKLWDVESGLQVSELKINVAD